MKTGAMLACSVTLGGIVAGASSTARQALDSYAQAIGLAKSSRSSTISSM